MVGKHQQQPRGHAHKAPGSTAPEASFVRPSSFSPIWNIYINIKKNTFSFYLVGEDSFWLGSGINTTGFDWNDKMTASFQKVVGVESDNTSLIGLGNIGKDTVYHANQHSVFPWMTSILDNGHLIDYTVNLKMK